MEPSGAMCVLVINRSLIFYLIIFLSNYLFTCTYYLLNNLFTIILFNLSKFLFEYLYEYSNSELFHPGLNRSFDMLFSCGYLSEIRSSRNYVTYWFFPTNELCNSSNPRFQRGTDTDKKFLTSWVRYIQHTYIHTHIMIIYVCCEQENCGVSKQRKKKIGIVFYLGMQQVTLQQWHSINSVGFWRGSLMMLKVFQYIKCMRTR